MDVVAIGGGLAHKALDKAEWACAIREEVGVAELEADVNA
jgi:hypothetical protein